MTGLPFGRGTEDRPTLAIATHPARPVVNMPAPVLGEPERCSCGSRFDDGRAAVGRTQPGRSPELVTFAIATLLQRDLETGDQEARS